MIERVAEAETSGPGTLPRIGILGGMGPLASAEFLVKLVRATPAARDQDHFPTTLDATPQIPDRPSALFSGGVDPFPAMVEVIRRLEQAGSALIVMPCNTVHHWYDRLQAESRLPILHIVDAVSESLREIAPDARRVGVLGSTVTSRLGIFENRRTCAWEWVTASDAMLAEGVMPAIAAVKAGDLATGRTLFLEATRQMQTFGIDALVYACTEIPTVLGLDDVAVPVVDSLDALAAHTVRFARQLNASRG